MSGATSLSSLIAKESTAQNAFESGEGQPCGVLGLHPRALGFGERDLRRDQVENRRGAGGVAVLLNAEAFAGHDHCIARQVGTRARRLVRIIGGGHVVLHGAVHVFACRAGNVLDHAGARQRQLALANVTGSCGAGVVSGAIASTGPLAPTRRPSSSRDTRSADSCWSWPTCARASSRRRLRESVETAAPDTTRARATASCSLARRTRSRLT